MMSRRRLLLSTLTILLLVNIARCVSIDRYTDEEANDPTSPKMTAKEKNAETEEGDLKLTPEQELAERGIIHLDEPLEDLSKWPSTTIPYVFDDRFDGQERIFEAFKEYERNSCIRFRPKRPDDNDYLYFYNGRGCWSFVGRIGGKQHISLPHYCRTTLGTPVHEILHALGFYHEQSRSDRDKYIGVEWEHIKPRAKGNFEEHEAQDHGYPYDYESVMHYGPHAFSRDGQETLRVLKGSHHIGQRIGMSKIDAAQLRAHYCGGREGPEGKREVKAETKENARNTIMCNPEEGEDCDEIDRLAEMKKKEAHHHHEEETKEAHHEHHHEAEREELHKEHHQESDVGEAREVKCQPEEGEDCDEKKKELEHPMFDEYHRHHEEEKETQHHHESEKEVYHHHESEKEVQHHHDETASEEHHHESDVGEAREVKCHPEEGEDCDLKDLEEKREKCEKYVENKHKYCHKWTRFCKRYNYKAWMAINCATSCEGECAE